MALVIVKCMDRGETSRFTGSVRPQSWPLDRRTLTGDRRILALGFTSFAPWLRWITMARAALWAL